MKKNFKNAAMEQAVKRDPIDILTGEGEQPVELEEQVPEARKVALSEPVPAQPAKGRGRPKRADAEKKQSCTFFVSPANYQRIQSLAHFRAATGRKDDRGCLVSVGSLIDEAIAEYLDRNRAELEAWENFATRMEKTELSSRQSR